MTGARLTPAVATASIAVATQIASKAARDGIFLGTYDAAQLPRAMIAAAILSIFAVVVVTWAMRRFGVGKCVPTLFAVSAALFLTEWWLVNAAPKVGAAALFGHVGALGALLISGFWSLVTDTFDARSARKHLGIIGMGATFGGLVGGVAAERLASIVGAPPLLLVLAGAQLVCAVLCLQMAPSKAAPTEAAADPASDTRTERNRYVYDLGFLVILLAVSAGLLDFLLKSQAEAYFGNRDQLTRFFGLFYTGTALLAFLLQAVLGRTALERLGLGVTAAVLPITLIVGGVGFVLVPSLVAAIMGRGGEIVTRSSLFRSAYELMFAPLRTEQRNRVKAWIDVGCERIGDAVAGGLVQLLLVFTAAGVIIAGSSVALAMLATIGVVRLVRGYVRELESRLTSSTLDMQENETMATMATIGLSGLELSRILPKIQSPAHDTSPTKSETQAPKNTDPIAERAALLRATDAEQVRSALASPLPTRLVPLAIELLSRDTVADAAATALSRVAKRHVGQLIDTLLDEDEPISTRRRIPRLLGQVAGARPMRGLLQALGDSRFELRLRSAEALLVRRKQYGEEPARDDILAAIDNELSNHRPTRFARRLTTKGIAQPSRRTQQPKQYLLLTLLALLQPIEPVASAYRALQTTDTRLRGLAFEYITSTVPSELKDPFLAALDAPSQATPRDTEMLATSLIESRHAIDAALSQEGANE